MAHDEVRLRKDPKLAAPTDRLNRLLFLGLLLDPVQPARLVVEEAPVEEGRERFRVGHERPVVFRLGSLEVLPVAVVARQLLQLRHSHLR